MYVVTRRGAEITDRQAVARARRELTVAPVSLNDPFPKKFRVYAEDASAVASTLVAPLHWAVAALGPPRHDARPPGKSLEFTFNGRLRPDLHQPEAVEAVLKTWGHGGQSQSTVRGAMLCCPPGFGKTTIALYLASVIKRRVLVIVHKSFLADQWAERVAQFLPGARVTRVQGDVCDTSGDVVIAMLQTLVSRKYPASTFDDCGMLVADECFPGRQLVATEIGPLEINKIYRAWTAGEVVKVWSFDEAAKQFVLKPVTHAWEKATNSELVKIEYSKSNIKATPNHKVLTTDGWKCAGDVRPGDLLVSRYAAGLSEQAVSSVSRYTPEDKRVYDLEVADTHTFVCCGISGNGAVVHNCHHIGAAVFSQAMLGLCLPYTLGLSATPDRKDGLSRVVGWFMGDMAFKMKRENQVSTRVDVVKYSSDRYDHAPPVNRRGDVCFTSIVTLLTNDDARTRLVAAHAARLATQHRDVLVLSHRREHCKALAEAIFELGISSVATYLGGDKSVPETQVIVATYSLTSEGFDLPRLNALVLATPASDVEQSCGRVMRGSSTSSSTRGAIIVDVVDQWGVCFAQAAKRRALYKRSGFMFDNANADEPSTTTFAFVDE